MNYSVLSVLDLPPAADPEAAKLPLLGPPWQISLLCVSYLLISLKIGKQFMDRREPYNIKGILIVYNFFQIIYNAAMFFTISYYLFIKQAYDLSCIIQLADDNPEKHIERWISYMFFVIKIIDMADTIFFLLRKSYKQITFLHVYHHVIMVYVTYWVIRLYGVGGQYASGAGLNCFVHTVMYFYYLISALNPNIKRSLWWKKYITLIQITQFVILVSQSSWILIFNRDCKFPHILQYLQFSQNLMFLIMFSNFYIKAYIRPQNKIKIN